jgi:hypothetical protein
VKRILKGWDEQDVLSPWRQHYCWTKKAGATSAVKRRYRRRERRMARQEANGAW